MKCRRCEKKLELSPTNFPYNQEYWRCPKCQYIYGNGKEYDLIQQVEHKLARDLRKVLNLDGNNGMD